MLKLIVSGKHFFEQFVFLHSHEGCQNFWRQTAAHDGVATVHINIRSLSGARAHPDVCVKMSESSVREPVQSVR